MVASISLTDRSTGRPTRSLSIQSTLTPPKLTFPQTGHCDSPADVDPLQLGSSCAQLCTYQTARILLLCTRRAQLPSSQPAHACPSYTLLVNLPPLPPQQANGADLLLRGHQSFGPGIMSASLNRPHKKAGFDSASSTPGEAGDKRVVTVHTAPCYNAPAGQLLVFSQGGGRFRVTTHILLQPVEHIVALAVAHLLGPGLTASFGEGEREEVEGGEEGGVGPPCLVEFVLDLAEVLATMEDSSGDVLIGVWLSSRLLRALAALAMAVFLVWPMRLGICAKRGLGATYVSQKMLPAVAVGALQSLRSIAETMGAEEALAVLFELLDDDVEAFAAQLVGGLPVETNPYEPSREVVRPERPQMMKVARAALLAVAVRVEFGAAGEEAASVRDDALKLADAARRDEEGEKAKAAKEKAAKEQAAGGGERGSGKGDGDEGSAGVEVGDYIEEWEWEGPAEEGELQEEVGVRCTAAERGLAGACGEVGHGVDEEGLEDDALDVEAPSVVVRLGCGGGVNAVNGLGSVAAAAVEQPAERDAGRGSRGRAAEPAAAGPVAYGEGRASPGSGAAFVTSEQGPADRGAVGEHDVLQLLLGLAASAEAGRALGVNRGSSGEFAESAAAGSSSTTTTSPPNSLCRRHSFEANGAEAVGAGEPMPSPSKRLRIGDVGDGGGVQQQKHSPASTAGLAHQHGMEFGTGAMEECPLGHGSARTAAVQQPPSPNAAQLEQLGGGSWCGTYGGSMGAGYGGDGWQNRAESPGGVAAAPASGGFAPRATCRVSQRPAQQQQQSAFGSPAAGYHGKAALLAEGSLGRMDGMSGELGRWEAGDMAVDYAPKAVAEVKAEPAAAAAGAAHGGLGIPGASEVGAGGGAGREPRGGQQHAGRRARRWQQHLQRLGAVDPATDVARVAWQEAATTRNAISLRHHQKWGVPAPAVECVPKKFTFATEAEGQEGLREVVPEMYNIFATEEELGSCGLKLEVQQGAGGGREYCAWFTPDKPILVWQATAKTLRDEASFSFATLCMGTRGYGRSGVVFSSPLLGCHFWGAELGFCSTPNVGQGFRGLSSFLLAPFALEQHVLVGSKFGCWICRVSCTPSPGSP